MRTLRTTALLAVLFGSATAGAQTYYSFGAPQNSVGGGAFYGSVVYQFGIPIGNTHDYISDVEWRGVGVDLGWMVKPSFSIGLALGWNVFYENTTTVITYLPGNKTPGFAISGNQDRSFNFFPLLADFRYLHRLKNGVRPFIGVGIGAYITTQYLGIGLSSFSETACQFGVAPELGVIIPVEGGAAVQLSARYNMAFAGGGVDFQQWLGLSLGVAWGPAL
jgi:hypothetical protein